MPLPVESGSEATNFGCDGSIPSRGTRPPPVEPVLSLRRTDGAFDSHRGCQAAEAQTVERLLGKQKDAGVTPASGLHASEPER